MILICRNRSEGAKHLVDGLNRLRPGVAQRLTGEYHLNTTAEDLVVSWGCYLPRYPQDQRVLNRRLCEHKLHELQLLRDDGIPVPVFANRPGRVGEWLPRTLAHGNGNDFKRYLAGERDFGDYYTLRTDIAREHRIHVFRGDIIKENTKYQSTATDHPWIRCEWGLGAPSRISARLRETALAAVAAIHYDFGAVDIGEDPWGAPIVLEVNSAPWLGLKEPNLPGVRAYATALLRYYDEAR